MRGQSTLLLYLLLACIALSSASTCADYPASMITWSSQVSWNRPGAAVVIKAGQNVLLDISPPQLGNITVYGGLYVANTNINVSVAFINVFAEGKFIVGTVNCPITAKVVFEFYGQRQTAKQSDMGADPWDGQFLGSKGVAIQTNATFIVYGGWQGPSWTNLAQIAWNGTSKIYLRNKVYWKQGDTIIVTSTDYSESVKKAFDSSVSWQSFNGYDEPDQTEEVVVSSVDSTGLVVTLTAPLKYTHWAAHYQYAEVGLLTRHVVFRGDNSSLDSEYGMQLMMRRAKQITIVGAEFTRGGQKGLMGRYPIHWHFSHDCTGMGYTILQSSSHHNFQRSLTIHETSGVFVQDVVAYKTFGHMYFLEVGGEFNNTFLHCLGAVTQPVPDTLSAHGLSPIQIIPSDDQPSVFWITNPQNNFTDNAAVGGLFGFWVSTPGLVLTTAAQAFHSPTYYPFRLPLKAFTNNTAHSSAQIGLMIGSGPAADGTPNSGQGYAGSMTSIFKDNTMYKQRKICTWAFNGIVHSGMKMIDCPAGIFHQGNSAVSNSIFVGISPNIGITTSMKTLDPPIGFTTYDVGTPSHSVNNTFINFTSWIISAGQRKDAGAHSISGSGIAPSVFIVNATYLNANPVSNWRIGRSIGTVVYNDADGSSTGIKGGGWFLSSGTWNQTVGLPGKGCQYVPACLAWKCPLDFQGFNQFQFTDSTEIHWNRGGDYSYYNWTFLNGTTIRQVYATRYNFTNVLDSSKFSTTRSNAAGNILGCYPSDPTPCNAQLSNIPNGQLINVKFVYNSLFRATPKVLWVSGTNAAAGDWTIVSLAYPSTAKITVTDHNTGANLTAVSSYALLTDTTYFFDRAHETLWLMYHMSAVKNTTFLNYLAAPYLFASPQYSFTSGQAAAIRVTAVCPNGVCAPSLSNLQKTFAPPTSNPYPTIINNLNKYTGTLTTCQVSASNSATFGSGVVQITYSPDWNEVQISLHHSLSNYGPVIVFGRYNSNKTNDVTYLTTQQIAVTSPVRDGFRPTSAFLAALYAGKLFVQVNTNTYPAGHIRANVYCDGVCSVPPVYEEVSPCPAPSADTFYLLNLNGTISSQFSVNLYNAVNWTFDSSNSYCGGASFIAVNLGGQVQFKPSSKSGLFPVNKNFQYLEFYAALKQGGPSSSITPGVYMRTSAGFTTPSVGIATYAINDVIDVDSGFQLVSIPLSAFQIPTSSFNLTFLIFSGTNTPYYINALRLTNKPSKVRLISPSVASRPSSYGVCKTSNPYIGSSALDGSNAEDPSSSPSASSFADSSSSPDISTTNVAATTDAATPTTNAATTDAGTSTSASSSSALSGGSGSNNNGEGGAEAQKTGAQSSAGKKGSMPIIIGGVVGGVALVAASVAGVMYYRQRALRNGQTSNPLYSH